MFSDVKSAPLGGIFRNLESEIRNPILIFRKSDTIRSGLSRKNRTVKILSETEREFFAVSWCHQPVSNGLRSSMTAQVYS